MELVRIRTYVNSLRSAISKRLKPTIGLKIDIYNCDGEGAILDIRFMPNGWSNDIYHEGESMWKVLSKVNQRLIRGDLRGVKFSGTSMSMTQENIVIVKDATPEQWTNEQLQEDLSKIFSPPKVESQ